jgi:RHS repeat-associated protein
VQASYRYDPFGRRIAKNVTQGSNVTTTCFQYNDQGLMGETDQNGKITNAYSFSVNPQALQSALWSTDPIWQANVQGGSLTDADTSYYYLHTDHLGTPMLATTKEGTVSWKAVSEAFGATAPLPETGISMNLRFPGQYLDEESGSYYNFQRDYRPNLGRYMQSDPINLDDGANIFAYAHQNPVNIIDPEGLFADGLRKGKANCFWRSYKTIDGRDIKLSFCYLGHSDFYCSNIFDYTSLDYDKPADRAPYTSAENRRNRALHFRNQPDVQRDLDRILNSGNGCNSFQEYEYLMHEGQDYYSHYKKGYSGFFARYFLGHALAGHGPDNDNNAWLEANEWTKIWADKWAKKCECPTKKCN